MSKANTLVYHTSRRALNYIATVVVAITIVVGAAFPALAAGTCGPNEVYVSIPVDANGTHCVPINPGSTNINDNPIFFYLINIVRFLTAGIGLAVAAGIIWGGYLYITARANASQVEKGKTVIINAVIGLLLYIFMFAILQFVIPGGIFG